MAIEAFLSEEGDPFRRQGNLVRVVTRSASETAPAFSVAMADLHLLDVPHGLGMLLHPSVKVSEEIRGGEPGPIVERAASRPLDAMITQEVALFADRSAKCRFKMPRIDDGDVPIINNLLLSRMQLSRSVAPLAADRKASKDGLVVQVDREIDGLHAVSVTEQALRLDGSIKM
jgi:hypothetical protein